MLTLLQLGNTNISSQFLHNGICACLSRIHDAFIVTVNMVQDLLFCNIVLYNRVVAKCKCDRSVHLKNSIENTSGFSANV